MANLPFKSISDFQLFFLLHFYILSQNKLSTVRIRPINNNFPLNLEKSAYQIGSILNEIEIFPEYSLFLTTSNNLGRYENVSWGNYSEERAIISHGSNYFQCLTAWVSNHKSKDWWIILTFNSNLKNQTESIKIYLEKYLTDFIENHSDNDYEFIKREERKLISVTQNQVWVLDLDFSDKSQTIWMLVTLILQYLWTPDGWSEMSILDIPYLKEFPYLIRFESHYYFPDFCLKPEMSISIKNDEIWINGSILFKDNHRIEYFPSKIMTYLLENHPTTHMWELNAYLYPEEEGKNRDRHENEAKAGKNLKDKVLRMRHVIIKGTWLDLFQSATDKRVILNTKLNLLIK